MTDQKITATESEMAAIFEEWLRRYNEEPERFTEEYGEPEGYGVGCADYFLRLHAELAEVSA
jgi:hypothetical protein